MDVPMQPVAGGTIFKQAAMVVAVAAGYALVSVIFQHFMWNLMEGAAQSAGMFDVGNSYAEARSKLVLWDAGDWRGLFWMVLLPIIAPWTTAPEKRHDRLARAVLVAAVMPLLIQWHAGSSLQTRFVYFVWTMAVLGGLETAAPVRLLVLPLFAGIIASALGDHVLFPTATLRGTPIPGILTLLEAAKSVADSTMTAVAGALLLAGSARLRPSTASPPDPVTASPTAT